MKCRYLIAVQVCSIVSQQLMQVKAMRSNVLTTDRRPTSHKSRVIQAIINTFSHVHTHTSFQWPFSR